MKTKPSNNGEMIERNEKGQILPGTILNPKGKPKGTKHFSTLFNEMVHEKIKLKDGTEMTMLRAMGLAMARKAMRGDVKAFAEVADRLDGKAVQGLEMAFVEPPRPIMSIKNRVVKNVQRNNSDQQNSESN